MMPLMPANCRNVGDDLVLDAATMDSFPPLRLLDETPSITGKRTISLPLSTRVLYDLDDGGIRTVDARYNVLVFVG
jgi:hypothetical protein